MGQERAIAGRDAGRLVPFRVVPGAGPADANRPIRHHVASRNDFEKLSEQTRLPLVFRPTGRSAPQFDIDGTLSPHLAIWTVSSCTGFESSPVENLDLYSIRVPLRGGVIRRTGDRDHETLVGSATILPAAEILKTRFVPGSEVLNCSISATELRARHEALEEFGPTSLRLRPLAKVDGPRMRALVHTIRQIGDHMGTQADALAGPLLIDILLNQLLSAWPRGDADVADSAVRAASRGMDYIDAHLAGPLTVGDVAAAACVSVRTLQSAFRAHIGRTPLGYILERRLERVHADLLANGAQLPVSQIAYRWGFLHMGEFSRRYRQRYGCLPSQTSRRAA